LSFFALIFMIFGQFRDLETSPQNRDQIETIFAKSLY
jgi:hypothetical protein